MLPIIVCYANKYVPIVIAKDATENQNKIYFHCLSILVNQVMLCWETGESWHHSWFTYYFPHNMIQFKNGNPHYSLDLVCHDITCDTSHSLSCNVIIEHIFSLITHFIYISLCVNAVLSIPVLLLETILCQYAAWTHLNQ